MTPRMVDNRCIDAWASSFESDAAGYSYARPGYPEALYDVLAGRCGLGPGCRVVEIGAGTGQATRGLLARGATVLAVEPGARLAEQLRQQCPDAGLAIVNARFEDAEVGAGTAELVASATAFHWLDPRSAWPKVASALRPDGWAALWWNCFYDPAGPDAFSQALEPLYEELGQAEAPQVVRARDRQHWLRALRDAGLADATAEEFAWSWSHTTEDLVALYATFSDTRVRPADQRRRFLDSVRQVADTRFGGAVERTYVTMLYTARKP